MSLNTKLSSKSSVKAKTKSAAPGPVPMEPSTEKTAKLGLVIPKTLGACADLLYKLRQERLEQARKVADLESQESVLREHIIQNLPKSELEGAKGKVGKVTLGLKTTVKITDWGEFYKYLVKTKNFALLQRRPGDAAIQEIWESGKKVPGAEPFNVVTLSITKA